MQLKLQLAEQQFQYNMQLEQLKSQTQSQNLQLAEDRKDERTRIQASQQSELVQQRKTNALPQSFESAQFAGMQDLGL
jgi:hypothetical protein